MLWVHSVILEEPSQQQKSGDPAHDKAERSVNLQPEGARLSFVSSGLSWVTNLQPICKLCKAIFTYSARNIIGIQEIFVK